MNEWILKGYLILIAMMGINSSHYFYGTVRDAEAFQLKTLTTYPLSSWGAPKGEA